MKKLKKGFSLAELLIALGIVAVIATMGFTISKQGIENAYNQYFYTGYKGIYDAITAASNDGLKVIPDRAYCGTISLSLESGSSGSILLCPGESYTFYNVISNGYRMQTNHVFIRKDFFSYINNLLRSKTSYMATGNYINVENIKITGGTRGTFTAPNNIDYILSMSPDPTAVIGAPSAEVDYTKTVVKETTPKTIVYTNNGPLYPSAVFITMTVPYVKGKIGKACLLYLPEANDGMLIPLSSSFAADAVDLQNRKDLLPFYIDDGESGRVFINEDGTTSYQKRKFYSFREAYCKQNNNQNLSIKVSANTTVNVVSCDGIAPPGPDENITGIIRVENPKKVF